jgi:hypothetical protein
MISPLLFLALAAPAHSSAPPPNPNAQRQAFTHCLAEMLATDLHANTAVDAFKAKLATICKAEEQAFRDASIRADLAVGIRAAAAQDNASSEIKDIVETQGERYKSYFETKTYPK